MGCCLINIISSSPEETEALGENLAGRLTAGSVIALKGALGAGKTCLVKGIARGLGITETITSPTYTIINEYNGSSVMLHHIDAYRLSGDDDFEHTGAGECIGGKGITVIEWSERIPRSIPAGAIIIHIAITGSRDREITIEGMEP
jgi:tRNA threonylcarbamoyladenosine biosynthesis protein TsaE